MSLLKIKDIERYDPKKVEEIEVLRDDWRLCLAHWSRKRRGEKSPYTYNQLADAATGIARELHKRGTEFHPEDYKKYSLELYKIVKKRLAREGIFLKATDGLYLVEPHARLIWKGRKKLIVKARRYDNMLNIPLYLLGDKAYGIIRLTRIIEINKEQFRNLRSLHLISERERKEWWKEKFPLYAYEFEFERFERPKAYVKPKGAQVFLRDVKIEKAFLKPFSHPLGKTFQLPILLANIPPHKIYVEPFAGGATLFWAKKPAEKAVLNDKDPEYAFILRFIKNASEEDLKWIQSQDYKPSRRKFEELKARKVEGRERAYRFIYLTMHSWGSMRGRFTERHRPKGREGLMAEPFKFQARMFNATVLNQDFEPVMKRYDSEDTFFYLDPPYLPGMAGGKEALRQLIERLAKVCRALKGKFLMSYFDEGWVRKLFKGFEIRSFKTQRSLKPHPDRELIIANYPLTLPRLKKADVRLTFLGTRGFVDESSKKHKKRASLLIEADKRILIDWGDVNGELPDVDAIIITHAHPDHLFGLINQELDIDVFINEACFKSEYFKKEKYEGIRFKPFRRRDSFEIGEVEITSVPVLHSTKAPNVALFLRIADCRFCYASDVLSISERDRDELLIGCCLYIGDGSTLRKDGLVRWDEKHDEAIGHASIHRQVKWCEDASVRRIIFTHFGAEPITKPEKLDELAKELSFEVAYDGYTTTLELAKSVNLEEIDSDYVRGLSDERLKKLYIKLHNIYREQGRITEALLNASIFVENEMKRRGIQRDIKDRLSEETRFWVEEYAPVEAARITLQEVIDSFPDELVLTRRVPAIFLVGGIVNRGWVEEHDIDIRVASDEYLPEVKRALIHACRRNDIREKLTFIFDSKGGIGLELPLYFPHEKTKLMKDQKLRVGKPSQPQKAATGEMKNEFWESQDAWDYFAAPRIRRGIMIEQKYDGMAMQVHVKDGKVIGIFTEDKLRNRLRAFRKSAEELPKLLKAKDAILAAEMVEYSYEELEGVKPTKLWYYKQIPREELVKTDELDYEISQVEKWIAGRPEYLDDERVVFHVHNLLHLDGVDYASKPAIERYKKMREVLRDGRHWHVTEMWFARNYKEFMEGVRKARYYPNSEGAMLKTADSIYKIRYDVAARNIDVAKIKNLKSIDVMVFEPHLVRGTKDVFTWRCYIGPVREQDLAKYRKQDLKRWKGKWYLKVGVCYNVKGKKPEGSILEVKPIKIDKEKVDDKVKFDWMFPKAGLWRPEKKEPDPIDVAEKIAKLGTRPMEKEAKVVEVRLQLCPEKYAFDQEICGLIRQVKIMVGGVWKSPVKLKIEELKFPIDCPLAQYYRCRRVKPYYYGFKEVEK